MFQSTSTLPTNDPMKRIRILIAVLTAGLIFLAGISIFCWRISAHGDSVVFLDTYGSIPCFADTENTVSLAMLAPDDFDDSYEAISVYFPSECVTVTSASLVKSIKYKNYALFYLNVEYRANAADNEITERYIVLNGTTYNLGSLTFCSYSAKHTPEYLAINSCAAVYAGVGLAPYHMEVENIKPEDILITDFSATCYDKAESHYVYNDGEERFRGLPEKLSPGKAVTLYMDFEDCSPPGADVYYVAPVLEYTYLGASYHIRLECYVSGLNISKDELSQLYKKYIMPTE